MKKLALALLIAVSSYAHAAEDFDVEIVDSRTDKDKAVVILTLNGKEHKLLVKKTDLKDKPDQISQWVDMIYDKEVDGGSKRYKQ